MAKAAGLPESQVTVHNHLLGGGFGRKLEPDMAYTAARIAKQVAGPVKVVWTREEDMRHDFYRDVNVSPFAIDCQCDHERSPLHEALQAGIQNYWASKLDINRTGAPTAQTLRSRRTAISMRQ